MIYIFTNEKLIFFTKKIILSKYRVNKQVMLSGNSAIKSPLRAKSPLSAKSPLRAKSPLSAKSPLRAKSPIKRRILFSAPVPFQYGECTVCHEETAFKIPGCNHYLCRSCYNGMRLSGRTMNCPLCRNRITRLT